MTSKHAAFWAKNIYIALIQGSIFSSVPVKNQKYIL